jgi:alpha-glucuronidase
MGIVDAHAYSLMCAYNRIDGKAACGSDMLLKDILRGEWKMYLLWFHHVKWGERTRSGRTLWEELVHDYNSGVDTVDSMRRTWQSLEGQVDVQRFSSVSGFLSIQQREARWWRDASLLYFGTFSRMPIPAGYEKPAHSLDYYMKVRCPADPRPPRCDSI